MAYANLPQAQALAKSRSNTVGFLLEGAPQLGGRLATIDPDGVREFNDAMRRWVQDLALRIEQAIGEVPKPS